MDQAEWEALCDGCGKCCGLTPGKPDYGIACPGLDCKTRRCTVYEKRLTTYACRQVTPENTLDLYASGVLPDSCAYVRHAKGLPKLDSPSDGVAQLIPFELAPRFYREAYHKANAAWQSARKG